MVIRNRAWRESRLVTALANCASDAIKELLGSPEDMRIRTNSEREKRGNLLRDNVFRQRKLHVAVRVEIGERGRQRGTPAGPGT